MESWKKRDLTRAISLGFYVFDFADRLLVFSEFRAYNTMHSRDDV